MNLGLEGKAVLVMASSAGLGRAIAQEFACAGAHVMLFGRYQQRLESAQVEIAQTCGNPPEYTVGDVRDAEAIQNAVARTAERFGSLFALINNCGGPPVGGFAAFGDRAWQEAFELTLLSYIRSIRAAIPYMQKSGQGRILNVASSSTKQVIDNLILSNTFRMGVVGLSKTLARELGREQILVNVISPGRINTARLRQLDQVRAERTGLSAQQVARQAAANIPLERFGEPLELARLAVFLCSQANNYITGQNILVDGGAAQAY